MATQNIEASRLREFLEGAHQNQHKHQEHRGNSAVAKPSAVEYDDSGKAPFGLSAAQPTFFIKGDAASVSAASLAATLQSKPYETPAVPAIVSSNMATAQPQNTAAAAASPAQTNQVTPSTDIFAGQKDNLLPVKFSFTVAGSMAAIKSGKMEPHFVLDLSKNVPGLQPGQSVLMAGMEVTQKCSTASIPVGVSFGGFGGKTSFARAGKCDGAPAHLEIPINSSISMSPKDAEKVFSAEKMNISTEHLIRYGPWKDIEHLRSAIQWNTVDHQAQVPMNHPIAEVMRLPTMENPAKINAQAFKATVKPDPQGKQWYVMDATTCNDLLDRINSTVLMNPEFRQRQSRLDNFEVTLTPQTYNEAWEAPELLAEDSAKQTKENNRMFQVKISGVMYVLPIPLASK